MTQNSRSTIEDANHELGKVVIKLTDKCKDSPYFTKPLTYLLGALYSVRMAQELGIPDHSSMRATNDPTDLLALATELAKGELRTEGRWIQGYWINNASVRTAASFERICKAIGFFRSPSAQISDRAKDAKRWFTKERNKHLKGPLGKRVSDLGTIWDSVNTLKHEFTAPDHRFVTAVNEVVLVRALTVVFILASENIVDISKAYESISSSQSAIEKDKEPWNDSTRA